MATDRATAISAAVRIRDGLSRRDNTGYGLDYLQSDAWLAADYLLGSPAEVKPVEVEPDNPVSPEFLRLIGFADITTHGNVWTIQDADGRELKYLFVGENPMSEPECHLLDGESDGATIPAPETEGDMIALCRLLKFPALPPA